MKKTDCGGSVIARYRKKWAGLDRLSTGGWVDGFDSHREWETLYIDYYRVQEEELALSYLLAVVTDPANEDTRNV